VPVEFGSVPELHKRARDLAQSWNEKRSHIERTEFGQIKGRSESLSTLLRNKDVATHLDRLDRCITGIRASNCREPRRTRSRLGGRRTSA